MNDNKQKLRGGMLDIQRKRRSSTSSRGVITLVVSFLVAACFFILYGYEGTPTDLVSLSQAAVISSTTTSATLNAAHPPQLSDLCLELQKVDENSKLDESTQKNPKCEKAQSKPGIEPAFHFGSFLPPDRVMHHMGPDRPHFQLLREQTEGKPNSVALDIGANQGFFSFYLAALGINVHSFEISPQNFEALQHGKLYNPPEISDKVHLYHMGISNKDGRFGMKGGGYTGYLKENPNGDILSLTLDCFAHHRSDIFQKEISFVKIDVEGFEIGVLEGASHSLFAPGRRIGSLIIEVGPDRWNRAGVTLQDGVAAMAKLSNHFQDSYVVLRQGDTCPRDKLLPSISASNPDREVHEVQLYKMTSGDWKPLLESMNEKGSDCNFWFTNP